MNPDSPKSPREALEARLTALLLGELTPEEAAEVRAAITQDPELSLLHARLKQTIEFVREAAVAPGEEAASQPVPIRMSPDKRARLLERFKVVRPKELAQAGQKRRRWHIPASIAAALVGLLLVAMMIPLMIKTKWRMALAPAESSPLRDMALGVRHSRELSRTELARAAETRLGIPVAPSSLADQPAVTPEPAPRQQATERLGRVAGDPAQGVALGGRFYKAAAERASAAPATETAARSAGYAIILPETPAAVHLWDAGSGSLIGTVPSAGQSAGGGAGGGERGAFTAGNYAWFDNAGRPVTTEERMEPLAVKLPAPSFKGTPADLAKADGVERQQERLGKEVRSLSERYDTEQGGLGGVRDQQPDGSARAFGASAYGGARSFAGRPAARGAQPVPSDEGKPSVAAGDKWGLASTDAGLVERGRGGRALAGGVEFSVKENLGETLTAALAPEAAKPAAVAGGAMNAVGRPVETERTLHFGFGTQANDKLARLKDDSTAKAKYATPVLGDVPALGQLVRGEMKALSAAAPTAAASAPQPTPPPAAAVAQPATPPPAVRMTELRDGALGVASLYQNNANGRFSTLTNRVSDFFMIAGGETPLGDKKTGAKQNIEAATGLPTEPQPIDALVLNSVAGKPVQVDVAGIADIAPGQTVVSVDGKPTDAEGRSKLAETEYRRRLSVAATGVATGPTAGRGETVAGLAEGRRVPAIRQRAEIALPQSEPAAVANRPIEEGELLKAAVAKSKREAVPAQQMARQAGANEKAAEQDVALKRVASAPVPQPEVLTTENPFSTFSLNVSDVSFKLAAASLEKGALPEAATVRSEEFINAFDYRDPEPPPGVPIAFAWERSRYPFVHNRDLLRFSVKTAAVGRQAGRPLNLVLLVDNSGSMERADRVGIIRQCLRVLVDSLQPQDKVSVVTFSRSARLWVDGQPAAQVANLDDRVGALTPEGGTNLEEAMNLAYTTAARHYLPGGVNRVVLLTDGAANLGNVDPEALKQRVEAQRRQGIALDCFGIGWEGYNDDLLEVLSRNGDGRYGFVNTPEDAATEFAGQLAGALKVAASDVKVQVEFNPRRVRAYRQIGYAKHQLKKEQFRDNTVDAAEIGAAEAGNALYVVEVDPRGDGPLGTVRVRYKVPGTSDYREHEWSVPFSGQAVPLEQANPTLRLGATAGAFSEWLASNPFAAEVTPDRLLAYLGGVPEVFGADARPKKLEWMIRQAKFIAGK